MRKMRIRSHLILIKYKILLCCHCNIYPLHNLTTFTTLFLLHLSKHYLITLPKVVHLFKIMTVWKRKIIWNYNKNPVQREVLFLHNSLQHLLIAKIQNLQWIYWQNPHLLELPTSKTFCQWAWWSSHIFTQVSHHP